MSNLPNWPGATECYSRAYALLVVMSRQVQIVKRGRKRFALPTAEMDHLIKALNQGDEETIKAVLLATVKE